MKNKPKYTILIPTRNGAAYVCYAVQSVLSQSYESVEVIVSVNHSEDDTLSKLSGFSDPRLSVISPPKLISMTKHFEWCLGHANGEWVTILGDDDAVMPFFFKEVDNLLKRWLKSEIDAISFRRSYYYWSGCEDVYGDSVVGYSACRRNYLVSGKRIIIGTITGSKNHFDLPQIYTNNLVRGELIKKLTEKSDGIFYNELTPDVYSGVIIALNANHILRSEIPVFWTGSSIKSTGMTHKRLDEHLNLAENDGLGVAEEISLNLAKTSGASSIFVLSSLLKCPSLNVVWRKYLRPLICIGFAQAIIHAYNNKNNAKGKNVSNIVLKRLIHLGISRVWLFLCFVPLILIRAWMFCVGILSAVKNKLGFTKIITFFSKSHKDFPDILSASKKINEIYYENNMFHY